jgi:hypothetical protein
MMTTNPTRTETERGKKGPSSRPVALGKVNLLLALLGLLEEDGADGPRRRTSGAATTSAGSGTDLVSQQPENVPNQKGSWSLSVSSGCGHMSAEVDNGGGEPSFFGSPGHEV